MQRIHRLIALWLTTACLVVALPLQSVSVAIVGLLGAKHVHRTFEPTALSQASMSDWRDFRRTEFDHVKTANYPHHHESGLRHHHDSDDESVVNLETPTDGDGTSSENLQAGAGLLFVVSENVALRISTQELRNSSWRAFTDQAFSSANLRRLDRPPMSVA